MSEKEKLVWCKAACGNNMHEDCFKNWQTAKQNRADVTCVYCRTPWQFPDAPKQKEKGLSNEVFIDSRRSLFIIIRDIQTLQIFSLACQKSEIIIFTATGRIVVIVVIVVTTPLMMSVTLMMMALKIALMTIVRRIGGDISDRISLSVVHIFTNAVNPRLNCSVFL
jgi:hypothetical protein